MGLFRIYSVQSHPPLTVLASGEAAAASDAETN